jgi:nucleotidyltransferase/DNA polymerase involved in DNA repair
MPKVMEETQISKARMLGGKLGKKVMCLLPEFETTMGSISRLLSLDRLERAIGVESARWVFDACRGIDSEEVKATLKVLPKSITVSTALCAGQAERCLSVSCLITKLIYGVLSARRLNLFLKDHPIRN